MPNGSGGAIDHLQPASGKLIEAALSILSFAPKIQALRKVRVRVARYFIIAGMMLFFLLSGSISGDAQEGPSPEKKAVPVITLENMTPPFLDYDYFQGIETYGFRLQASGFSPINAWWLAEAATLVYADEDFVRKRFERAGLREIVFFDRRSTQCYVANNDDFAIVAFRGSEIWKKRGSFDLDGVVADLMADVDVRLTDWPPGGRVHRGFKEALDEVWPDLLPRISDLASRGCPIWITGHSLGGALAVLCGSLFGRAEAVYALGCPKVGDENFRNHLRTTVYRIVNNEDIVDRTPPFFVYVHVGQMKFIDRHGLIGDVRVKDDPSFEPPRDDTDEPFQVIRSRTYWSGGNIPPALRDHVPLLYAVHLWNNLVDSGQ